MRLKTCFDFRVSLTKGWVEFCVVALAQTQISRPSIYFSIHLLYMWAYLASCLLSLVLYNFFLALFFFFFFFFLFFFTFFLFYLLFLVISGTVPLVSVHFVLFFSLSFFFYYSCYFSLFFCIVVKDTSTNNSAISKCISSFQNTFLARPLAVRKQIIAFNLKS